MDDQELARPLEGIRVVDLSRLVPGPFATRALAELGADVIRVESPRGDTLRHLPPLVDGRNPVFDALHRGKRSVALELRAREARDALLAMCARADVLVDGFRPGVLEAMGLGPDVLRASCPRLVLARITGFGSEGADALRAGHDLGYVARAGILGLTGPRDGAPTLPGAQVADMGGALVAVNKILAALLGRARTGRGAVVEVSLTDAAAPFAIIGLATAWAGEPRGATRGDAALAGGLATYQTYRTKDERFVALGALEPKFWASFARVAGIDPDPMACVPGPHQAAIVARVAAAVATRTRDEWVAATRETDACLEPVLEPAELGDEVRRAVLGASRAPVPELGEHTDDVLGEVLSEAARAALYASGAAYSFGSSRSSAR